MKLIIGFIIVCAVGYLTYSFVQAEKPKTDSTIVKSDYNGPWNISLKVSSGATCSSASTVVNAQNGIMKSTLKTNDGVSSFFSATVSDSGEIKNAGSANLVFFDGLVFGGIGKGNWSDKYGCTGTFIMNRPDGVSDGVQYVTPQTPSSGQDVQQENI